MHWQLLTPLHHASVSASYKKISPTPQKLINEADSTSTAENKTKASKAAQTGFQKKQNDCVRS